MNLHIAIREHALKGSSEPRFYCSLLAKYRKRML